MGNINWLLLENRLRATPLNFLEQGLENKDWECIKLAYTMLTGKVAPSAEIMDANTSKAEKDWQSPSTLNPPLPAKSEAEAEEDDDDDDDDEDEEAKPRKKKKNLLDRVAKVNVKGIPNKFVDDGIAAAEDIQFLPKEPMSESLLRQRRPEYKKVKVSCSKCAKTERVDPMLAPKKLDRNYKMRYVCNDCSCGG